VYFQINKTRKKWVERIGLVFRVP